MTVPHLMNCDHSKEGWCLDCVVKLGNENWRLQKEIVALQTASEPLECCKPYTPQSTTSATVQVGDAGRFELVEAALVTPQSPMTDDQIYELYSEPCSDSEMIAFARAIEAHHKIGVKP